MRRPLGIACAIWLSLVAGDVEAQQAAPQWTTYLNANDVRGLAQDGHRLWIATSGGAVAYDPVTGETHSYHRRRDGLLSDSLKCVSLSSDGRIWFGTERAGISVLTSNPEAWEAYTSALRPIPGNRIQRVSIHNDSLFVATAQGMAVFVGGEQRIVCQEGVDLCGLRSFDVRDITGAKDGIWLATGAGVAHRDTLGAWVWPARDTSSTPSQRLLRFQGEWVGAFSTDVRALRDSTWVSLGGIVPGGAPVVDLLGEGDTLYAASGSGVWWFPGQGTWQRVGDATFPASSLLRMGDGTLWAGAVWLGPSDDLGENLDGLYRLSGDHWQRVTFPGPSIRSHYLSLAFDTHGTLWTSTAQRGTGPMYQTFDGSSWGPPNSLNDWTFALLFDPSGDLWFGHCCCRETGCNIQLLKQGALEDQEPRNMFDMAYDAAGNLWCASDQAPDQIRYAEGIWFRSAATGSWTEFKVETAPQMLTNRVHAILPLNGEVWVGYDDKGVHRWNLGPDGIPLTSDDTWTLYSVGTSGRRLISDSITKIAARGSRVWIGTTAGVTIVDPGDQITNIGAGFDRLPTPVVNAIIPVPDGGAWIATAQGGITRLTPSADGFTYTNYNAPDLPHPNVENMILDPDGRSIWAGTSRGLAHLIPSIPSAGTAGKVAAYPNPFAMGCTDGVRLLNYPGLADGVVVDLSGKIINRFTRRAAGDLIWNGRDGSGRALAPGLYWIRLNSPGGMRAVAVGLTDGPCGP